MNSPNPYQPGNAPIVPTAQPEPTKWRWSYSRWIGVMYGPIPVGIIVAVIALAVYYSTQ